MKLKLTSQTYAVCQLSAGARIPEWALLEGFFSISQTADELSVVCEERHVPMGIKAEKDWRLLKVEGPLDFALTGILASIATPLAEAKVSIFAISTFETDYVLVKARDLAAAVSALEAAGFALR